MPIETALTASEGMDAESVAVIERAKGRMPVASVRRDGMGNPEPLTIVCSPPECGLLFRVIPLDPRAASPP